MTIREKIDRTMHSLEAAFERRERALVAADATDALIDARWRHLVEVLEQPGARKTLERNKSLSRRFEQLERKMNGGTE